MYMNTAIVGNLSGNVQITHNCNIGQVRDLFLLLFLGILLDDGTVAEKNYVARASATTKHSVLLGHIVALAEPSTFGYTVFAVQIVAVAQIVVVAVAI